MAYIAFACIGLFFGITLAHYHKVEVTLEKIEKHLSRK